MIAIDTNVLLRYLLVDDASQHSKAKAIIQSQCPVLITDVVLVETVWTLTGKRYSFNKAGVCGLVRALVGDGAFVFESSQVVWSALCDYEESMPVRGKALDFADALIVNKAHFTAENKGVSLEGFYSFDKAIEQLKTAKKP
ncbi:MAG: type II toxin-antitoxin system VapC family toxin [Gammaproteobacteria bacterium]|nr:type II toxin-antitoxin system VapC family toxin [Gammaproteobacteria bacterium]MBL4890255.1 type II toxin-antitoxin system VapC family toxin [Rhizobiaceae bacterium]